MPDPEPRIIDTADVLRALPYNSPVEGWHGHGQHLVPTAQCSTCNELRRRQDTQPPPLTGRSRGE